MDLKSEIISLAQSNYGAANMLASRLEKLLTQTAQFDTKLEQVLRETGELGNGLNKSLKEIERVRQKTDEAVRVGRNTLDQTRQNGNKVLDMLTKQRSLGKTADAILEGVGAALSKIAAVASIVNMLVSILSYIRFGDIELQLKLLRSEVASQYRLTEKLFFRIRDLIEIGFRQNRDGFGYVNRILEPLKRTTDNIANGMVAINDNLFTINNSIIESFRETVRQNQWTRGAVRDSETRVNQNINEKSDILQRGIRGISEGIVGLGRAITSIPAEVREPLKKIGKSLELLQPISTAIGAISPQLQTMTAIINSINSKVKTSTDRECNPPTSSKSVTLADCDRSDPDNPKVQEKTVSLKAQTGNLPAFELIIAQLNKLIKQECKDCRCVAVVPDHYTPRLGSNRPQLAIYYQRRDPNNPTKLIGGRSLIIPHFAGSPDWVPPDYESGAYFARLTLTDNSICIVYCKDQQEAQRVAGLIDAVINPHMKHGTWSYSISGSHVGQKPELRVAMKGTYFPEGRDKDPTWQKTYRERYSPSN